MRPTQIVEAVLFASDAPLQAEEIARADQALDEDVVEQAIQELQREYDDGERAYQVREVAGGYQIMTRPEFAPYLERFDTVPRPSRLSGPALETLAIIAYRQPIGRIEIEYIRGVGSSGVIRTLQERGLVEVVGRAEGLGRPLLYGTGTRFLEHFGFRSLEDLPRPEELPVVLRDRTSLGLDEPEEDEQLELAEAEHAPNGGDPVEGGAATGGADRDPDPAETVPADAAAGDAVRADAATHPAGTDAGGTEARGDTELADSTEPTQPTGHPASHPPNDAPLSGAAPGESADAGIGSDPEARHE